MPSLKTVFLTVYLIVAVSVAAFIHTKTWVSDTRGTDVYYAWLEGGRILNGVNPYGRVLEGNMLENDKYATYFPLFYLLSAATQAAGLETYDNWIQFWRVIFLAFNLAIGGIIFLAYYEKKHLLAAVMASLLWLLNNWAITVSYIATIDFIPLFFLVLSLYLFGKRWFWSLFCLSLSLALKQLAIFLVPIYLIWLWQAVGKRPFKEIIIGGALIASVPLFLSLPFIAWEAEGFFRSIVFSATRYSVTRSAGTELAGSGGLGSRLPLFLVLSMIYLLVARRQLGRYTSPMLSMLAFAGLTPVLFRQYMVWVIALVILAAYDVMTPPDAAVPPPPPDSLT